MFKRDSTKVKVSKRKKSIIEMLKERFQEEQCEGDWWIPIKEALMKEEDTAELKLLKDYALVMGELYRRMLGGVLSRYVEQEEAQRKLKKVHDKTYGSCGEVSLTADFKGQASIGRTWVKMQTESKPSVGPANLQQIEKKVTMYSSKKTGEAHSYST